MSLKTFVKVSNITNLSDARYCAGMMVDILGFKLDPTSNNGITAADFKEISAWISGVSVAVEFENAEIDDIRAVIEECDPDWVQVNHLGLVESVRLPGKEVIYKTTVHEENDLIRLKSELSYLDKLVKLVVLKCTKPRLNDQLDALIGLYSGNIRLLKGFGIEAGSILSKYPGIELEAIEEDRPGFKDYGEVMEVLEGLEED